MEPCVLPAAAQRGRRTRGALGCRAMRVLGRAALWVLLLAQVGVQVGPDGAGGVPRSPPRAAGSHRGLAAVFPQAPACAVGPAAASPGSPSVRRPPGPAEWPGWGEKGGKSARGGRVVRTFSAEQLVNARRLVYKAPRRFLTQGIPCKTLRRFPANTAESTFSNIYIISQ